MTASEISKSREKDIVISAESETNIENKDDDVLSNLEYVKREVTRNQKNYSKALGETSYIFLKA